MLSFLPVPLPSPTLSRKRLGIRHSLYFRRAARIVAAAAATHGMTTHA